MLSFVAALKAKSTAMSPRERLTRHVEGMIINYPRLFEGHLWAELPQQEWASIAGCAVATLRRIIAQAPFVRCQTHASDGSGKRITLLRTVATGEAAKPSPRHLANIMRRIWCERTGFDPGPRGWGCLKGLAEEWPEGHQIEILKLALQDWPAFIAGFWLAMDTGQIDLGEQPVKYMKIHHPHPPTLRLGWKVALDLYHMHLQGKVAKAA